MKVVIDATTLDGLPSGAHTRLAALGAELARRDDVQTTYLVAPGVDPLPGVPCREVRGGRSPGSRARWGRVLDGVLRDERAELFHAAALPLPRVGAAPVVATLHDLRFLHGGAGQGMLRRLWARHLLAPNLARARRLVVVSRHTRDEVVGRGLFEAARVDVVSNAATPGLARCVDVEAVAAFRRRAGLNQRYVIALGPVASHKRVGELLELIAAVRGHPEGADLALVLAGRVDPERALIVGRRARSLGVEQAVRLVGVLDDDELAAALTGAEALVSAGRDEGFSIPVVDAQALALPVVAVAAGAVPEVAGDDAWLVDPGDVPAMASALLDAVTPGDLREARLASARRGAARWSWAASADALVASWRAARDG